MKKWRVTSYYTGNIEVVEEVEAETEEEAKNLANGNPEDGEITKWWYSSEDVEELI